MPIGVFVVLLGFMDWRLDGLFRNLDSTGGLLLDLLLDFLVNAALALGAWNFLKLSQSLQRAVLGIAVTVAAFSVAEVSWDTWLLLHGSRRFQGADEVTIISGLGGRSVLAIGYILLLVTLARALLASRVRAKG